MKTKTDSLNIKSVVREPRIYAYSLPNDSSRVGQLKIGFTERTAEERIKEQIGASKSKFIIELDEIAVKNNGDVFNDKEIHNLLTQNGFERVEGEWFKCTADNVKAAIISLKEQTNYEQERNENFGLRREQQAAIDVTKAYFEDRRKRGEEKIKFLWNAKMRFGKTFTSYKLAEAMGLTKILVLTYKPAVSDAWETDLRTHLDFTGWQFINLKEQHEEPEYDKEKPIVTFGSYQDILGKKLEKIKEKNEWVHALHWDLLIVDEYHYGAWRDAAKAITEEKEKDDSEPQDRKTLIANYTPIETEDVPITSNFNLYLSGTPFRAITEGEFMEDQIFNWTYQDEQTAKENWSEPGENPYAALPKMTIVTYKVPEEIDNIAADGIVNEFSLNKFFEAEGTGANARFKREAEVQKWLDLIRGSFKPEFVKNHNLGYYPFSHTDFLENLNHMFWFLPKVNSCYAMQEMLQRKNNQFYHDYTIVVAAGNEAGMGVKALEPVKKAIGKNGLLTKTITLSVGKLSTGVTVNEWSAVMMLRDIKTPETYFQTAFRAQSPWTRANPDKPSKKEIIKEKCFVFDFSPNRALSQIVEYADKLNQDTEVPQEEKIKEFINFLPVISFENGELVELDPISLLQHYSTGTTATLLAKKWSDPKNICLSNDVLKKILSSPEALRVIDNIEDFRAFKSQMATIVNKSENIKDIKAKAKKEGITAKEKKELTESEKEVKSARKMILEKLLKFVTRLPVFMYLTDYIEISIKDLIYDIEPQLFKKATGLDKSDFKILENLGLFNTARLNEGITSFRSYERYSLEYSGITRERPKEIGLFDTKMELP